MEAVRVRALLYADKLQKHLQSHSPHPKVQSQQEVLLFLRCRDNLHNQGHQRNHQLYLLSQVHLKEEGKTLAQPILQVPRHLSN